MQAAQKYAYCEGHSGLLNSCDILLKLDDGSEIPAHSQILARCSGVFADMLDIVQSFC